MCEKEKARTERKEKLNKQLDGAYFLIENKREVTKYSGDYLFLST